MRLYGVLILFSLCSALFFSCVSKAKEEKLFVNLTDSTKFFLLPPEDIEKEMDMAQYLSAEFIGQNYFLVAWVKAGKNEIEMAFFNELGAGIGELSYKEDAVNFSSSVIPRAALRYLKPEYIVADFQLCFFEPDILGKALEDIGLVLEIENRNRRIKDDNEVIIEIIKTGNSVKLINYLREYSYTMEGDFPE